MICQLDFARPSAGYKAKQKQNILLTKYIFNFILNNAVMVKKFPRALTLHSMGLHTNSGICDLFDHRYSLERRLLRMWVTVSSTIHAVIIYGLICHKYVEIIMAKNCSVTQILHIGSHLMCQPPAPAVSHGTFIWYLLLPFVVTKLTRHYHLRAYFITQVHFEEIDV